MSENELRAALLALCSDRKYAGAYFGEGGLGTAWNRIIKFAMGGDVSLLAVASRDLNYPGDCCPDAQEWDRKVRDLLFAACG